MLHKNNNRSVVKNQDNFLSRTDLVKISRQGLNFAEVTACEKSAKQVIKKIDKQHYVNTLTGEVKEFEKHNKKEKNNLRKTFNNLRALIRTNFSENSKNQLFITLTYKENMTDEKRLYNDFNKFMKRLKYTYKQYDFEYIVVAEPQQRGAWHMHLMLKCTNLNNLYIDNKDLEKIWGFGYTDCQRLKSDDVGSYYVAYFTDICIDENSSHLSSSDKKHIKGSRLSYYPVSFKFYRCSRGIKKPSVFYETFDCILDEYGQPVYETCFNILDNEENVVNRIYKASFKKQQ